MHHTPERKVSGRMVFITLVAFFGVITAVNAVMATLAIRTFGGVEANNAYQAGLEFARELAAAKKQEASRIRVDVVASAGTNGATRFTLTAQNIEPRNWAEFSARLELRHPADKRHDHMVVLTRSENGVFAGEAEIEPGQWNARVSLDRGGERVFRSVNRISIP